MRCHQCFRIANEPTCRYCGTLASMPLPQGSGDQADDVLISSLGRPHTAPDDLWDMLCLTCVGRRPPAQVDERVVELALSDLSPAAHCVLGTWLAHRADDAIQAAAHFATACDGAEQSKVRVGPATYEFRAKDGDQVTEVWLSVDRKDERLGVLDRQRSFWLANEIPASRLLTPASWIEWKSAVLRRHTAVMLAWHACFPAESSAPAEDSGFRQRWKEFQLDLGDHRDRLGVLREYQRLLQTLDQRDRTSLKSLDATACVAQLLEAARNSMGQCANSLREKCTIDTAKEAREAYEQAFLRGGFNTVAALRDEIRVSSSISQSELRKNLEYQCRLLRGAQDALRTSLAEIARRANSFFWPFTPRALFLEAREQASLVVERAREVAMVEQTDAFLTTLFEALDDAGHEMIETLQNRQAQLDSLRCGLERVTSTLGIESESDEPAEPAANAGVVRQLVRDMQPDSGGALALLQRLEQSVRAREKVLA